MQQTVTFTSDELGVTVTTQLDEDVPSITAGAGGVTQVSRPRRKPLTDYDDIPLIVQEFAVIIDGYPNRVVDQEVTAIETLAGIGRTEGPLPVVRLAGPVRYAGLAWLIDDLDAQDEIRDGFGRYLRCGFKVKLIEYVDPSQITTAPGKRSKGKSKAKIKRYRVKKGDNLRRIAAKLLGSSDRWKEIARHKANRKYKLRKPDDIKPGQLLRIP